MSAATHPLYAAVRASAEANPDYGFDDLVGTLTAFLKSFVDTPEERAAIKAVVLTAFDQFVAPRLGPIVATVFRRLLPGAVDSILEALAG